MANPASQNCRAKGGRLEIRADQKGNETGFCVFPDGSSCDEWAFMDGKCAPGQHR
jgi:inhibitor of cysteine peptidase